MRAVDTVPNAIVDASAVIAGAAFVQWMKARGK